MKRWERKNSILFDGLYLCFLNKIFLILSKINIEKEKELSLHHTIIRILFSIELKTK